jgi:hypothetical protein
MKVSYMLLNNSDMGNGVPAGMAWQWIHCLEHEKQLVPILKKVQKIIKENWLTFANFKVDKQNDLEKFMGVAHEIIRNQIYYDEKITPERIFYINEDLRDEEEAENL